MTILITSSSQLADLLLSQNMAPLAYLDPGSGSIILQLIIAAAAGIAYTLRVQIGNFFRFITGKSREERKDDDVSDDDS